MSEPTEPTDEELIEEARNLLPLDTIEYDELHDYIAHLADRLERAGAASQPTAAEVIVRTTEQLDSLPVKSIVMSAAGTVACRFDSTKFACLGDDRPGEPWHLLALPARVLYDPREPQENLNPPAPLQVVPDPPKLENPPEPNVDPSIYYDLFDRKARS